MLAKAPPIDPKQVHRIKARRKCRGSCSAYEDICARVSDCLADQLPRFDLVLLGMGPEGHQLLSFFPGTKAFKEERSCRQQLGGKPLHRSHHPHSAGLKQCGAGHLHGSRREKAARAEAVLEDRTNQTTSCTVGAGRSL